MPALLNAIEEISNDSEALKHGDNLSKHDDQ